MLASSRLLLVAALAALTVTACGGGDDAPDMQFPITFDRGLGCSAAGVDTVRLSFTNSNIGAVVAPCSAPQGITIVVSDVAPGTYQVFAEGLQGGEGGFPIYSDRFDVTHSRSGSHVYPLDLRPATELVTRFTFAAPNVQGSNIPGLTCQQAQISSLNIVVGSVRFDNVPCTANGQDAAALLGVPTGAQTVVVDAFDAQGNKLYSSTFQGLQIREGASNEYTLNLLPLVKGGLALSWDCNGSPCNTQGVATVEYTLVNGTGQVVDTQSLASTQFPVTYGHNQPSSALDAGIYSLSSIRAKAANGAVLFQATSVPLYAPAGRTQGFLVTMRR